MKLSRPLAIDYTPAYHQRAGIGRLVRELVSALARLDQETPYRLFLAGVASPVLPSEFGANFSLSTTRVSPNWLARIWRVRVPLQVTALCGPVSLYHATDFVLPPLPRHIPSLLTVHDLSFVCVPEAAPARLRAYLNDVVPRSVRRATHVIADSSATKSDLVHFYNVDPDKISVLLSGIDLQRFCPGYVEPRLLERYGLDRPYILSVGTVQPRKNYSRLVWALARLRQRGYDVLLAIAGGKGWLNDDLYATLCQSGMADFVKILGFVEESHLPGLYRGAEVLALPSLYEGFGFPVLEAMACGTPVITSNISSLPEVAGDAALLVDPLDLDEITDALQRILDYADLRQNLIARGYLQAQKFTWSESARKLRGIYNEILR
ncbi:MAG: glycosyltransferase family 1 protein [Anaerolineae bacterium]|nr:glycosyltransferase family 1 protein [Anaerolineae bacterium]